MDKEQLFELGSVVATTGLRRRIGDTADAEILKALRKHQAGDWGDVGSSTKKQNAQALREGERILSAYVSAYGVKFWVITEWDRSVTTALLPEEY